MDKLKGQIADVQALADLHRPLFNVTLTPLRERFQALMRGMALWLDERLQGKDLRPAQKRTALEILCGLCAALVAGGDESMRALHDKRSRHSLDEKDQAAAAGMRAMMEDVFGKPLEVDESLDPVDAVMRAAMAHMQEATQAEQRRKPNNGAVMPRGPTKSPRRRSARPSSSEKTPKPCCARFSASWPARCTPTASAIPLSTSAKRL